MAGVEEGYVLSVAEASAPVDLVAYVLEAQLLQFGGRGQRLAGEPAIDDISSLEFSQFDVD